MNIVIVLKDPLFLSSITKREKKNKNITKSNNCQKSKQKSQKNNSKQNKLPSSPNMTKMRTTFTLSRAVPAGSVQETLGEGGQAAGAIVEFSHTVTCLKTCESSL